MKRSSRILLAFMLLTFVSRLVLAFRPELKLTERPYQEDAFYMFACASQMAQGHGFSMDGINPTNGVQPLIVVLYAPFFWLAGEDRWFGLRLTFVLVALLETLCVYMVYRLIRTLKRDGAMPDTAALLGAGLWTFLYTLLVHNANGLETGLLSTLYLAVLWRYSVLLKQGGTIAGYAWLGVLLGLLVLARIDAAIFVAALIAFDLLRERFSTSAFKRALVVGSIAVLVSSPWFIYNLTEFGSLMPISGQSESMESLLHVNLYTAPQVLADILSVFFYTPFNEISGLAIAAWCIACATTWAIVLRRTGVHRILLSQYDIRPLIPLLVAGVALLIYYTFFFSAPHFIARYMQPMRIAVFLLVTLAIPVLLKDLPGMQISVLKRPIGAAIAVAVLLAAYFNIALYMRAFNTEAFSPAHMAGLYAQQVSPERVGMTSSGTASFISANVVNLDGKVNYDALLARKQDKLGEYVVKANINYIADWSTTAEKIAAQARELGAEYSKIDSLGPILIYKRLR